MWIWLGFRKCQAVTQANNACKQCETANALNSFIYIVVFYFCLDWQVFCAHTMIFVGVGRFFQETKTCFPIGLTLLFHEFHLWPRISWVRSVGCHNRWFDCVGNISQGWGCKCCSLASVIQFEIPMELRLALWDCLPSHAEALYFGGLLGDTPITKPCDSVTFMALFCFGMVD